MIPLPLYQFKDPVEALENLNPGGVLLQIQGRLGNQLFGLSEAWRLHKIFETRVTLDITPVVSAGFGIPEWVEICENWDWMSCLINENEFAPNNQIGITNLSNCQDIENHRYFRGFRNDLLAINESGLFEKGVIPKEFASVSKHAFNDFVAVSVRLGDYSSNPHLGILPLRYYEFAVKKLPDEIKKLPKVIFSDDLERTAEYFENSSISPSSYQTGQTALESLVQMSSARAIINSNSTFSFWASYFCSGTILSPNPFYLGIPTWHKDLMPKDFIEVTHTKFPRLSYKSSLIRRKISARIMSTRHTIFRNPTELETDNGK